MADLLDLAWIVVYLVSLVVIARDGVTLSQAAVLLGVCFLLLLVVTVTKKSAIAQASHWPADLSVALVGA